MNALSINAVRPEYTSKPDEDYTPCQFGKYVKCNICGHEDGAPNMVECSGCGTFQHRDCLNPFHYEPISGEFLCSKSVTVTLTELEDSRHIFRKLMMYDYSTMRETLTWTKPCFST